MKHEFAPYCRSLKLKELGFDESCFGFYYDDGELKIKEGNISRLGYINAPTFSQAFRWFREKHGLYSHVRESYAFDNTLGFVTLINGSHVNHGIKDKPINRFETYEEAELACLNKLIEIVIKQQEQ